MKRALAAVLLAGALTGVAAFAHLLGGVRTVTPSAIVALPPGPASPLVVQAAPLPAVAPARVTVARPQIQPQAPVLHVGFTRPAAPIVVRARPIAITPVTVPSAAPAPTPAAPAPTPAAPAPTPAAPTPELRPTAPAPIAAPLPADRVLASAVPVLAAPAVAVPAQPSDREHRQGHHGGGKRDDTNNGCGNHDDQNRDNSAPALLAVVPLNPVPLDPAQAPVVEPAATPDAPPVVDGTADDHGSHEHHGHGHDRG